MIINESKNLNESKSYKKGDKIKFILPDTLDVHMEGTIDHKASTEEINDAGWDNCTEKDNFYVINTKYKGKDTQVVSPVQGIFEKINESVDPSKIKSGSYVAYKWWQGGKFGPYIDWIHVENLVKSPTGRLSNFTGWWNGESLKTDLWTNNVIYVSNSKSDIQNYVKNHTDPKGYYKE